MAGQVYVVNTLGGRFTLPYLADKLREAAQPRFVLRQFVDVVEAIGKGRGDTYNFDKVSDVVTAGGTLVETDTMPQTNFTVQIGTGTVIEYGNSVPYTEKLATLSQFSVSPAVERRLVNDQVRILESAAGDQYILTEFVGVNVSTASTDIVTTGTATATANANLTAANTRAYVDFLKQRDVPKYDGRDFIMVGSVQAISGMHADTAEGGWQEISKYTAEFASNIFNGEVGRFYGARFVEETGYLSNALGTGAAFGQSVLFGSDSVIEAVTTPEEIRVKVSTDYNRDLGLAWYALLGFQIVWDFSADSEQHIMLIGSA